MPIAYWDLPDLVTVVVTICQHGSHCCDQLVVYYKTCCIFNSLLSVWKCDETLSLVFEILYQLAYNPVADYWQTHILIGYISAQDQSSMHVVFHVSLFAKTLIKIFYILGYATILGLIALRFYQL